MCFIGVGMHPIAARAESASDVGVAAIAQAFNDVVAASPPAQARGGIRPRGRPTSRRTGAAARHLQRVAALHPRQHARGRRRAVSSRLPRARCCRSSRCFRLVEKNSPHPRVSRCLIGVLGCAPATIRRSFAVSQSTRLSTRPRRIRIDVEHQRGVRSRRRTDARCTISPQSSNFSPADWIRKLVWPSGHTPGHTNFLIQFAGEKLLLGDRASGVGTDGATGRHAGVRRRSGYGAGEIGQRCFQTPRMNALWWLARIRPRPDLAA